jgi:hypothetical protein
MQNASDDGAASPSSRMRGQSARGRTTSPSSTAAERVKSGRLSRDPRVDALRRVGDDHRLRRTRSARMIKSGSAGDCGNPGQGRPCRTQRSRSARQFGTRWRRVSRLPLAGEASRGEHPACGTPAGERCRRQHRAIVRRLEEAKPEQQEEANRYLRMRNDAHLMMLSAKAL